MNEVIEAIRTALLTKFSVVDAPCYKLETDNGDERNYYPAKLVDNEYIPIDIDKSDSYCYIRYLESIQIDNKEDNTCRNVVLTFTTKVKIVSLVKLSSNICQDAIILGNTLIELAGIIGGKLLGGETFNAKPINMVIEPMEILRNEYINKAFDERFIMASIDMELELLMINKRCLTTLC